jgi:hypothetical protein
MMGFFDRIPDPVPATQPPKYTVEKVQERLDAFGLLRLSVQDPELKVLITRVTQGALPYLERISVGNPSGAQISEMMTTLDMLIDTVTKYVSIQDSPQNYQVQGGVGPLLQAGLDSVNKYHEKLQEGAQGGDLTGYHATTDFLTGNMHTI